MKNFKHIRNLFLPAVLVLFSINVQAQDYVWHKKEGVSPYGYKIQGGQQDIMEGLEDNQLSEWQKLPFEWTFYGENVEGYYVSDNGYITFDRTAKKSFSQNTGVPSPEGPNNAIYACWGAWTLSESPRLQALNFNTRRIQTLTFGEAPARRHVINWINIKPESGNSQGRGVNMMLVLKEEGGFDILMASNYNELSVLSTVGVENADGTKGAMIGESPRFNLSALKSTARDDITWSFEYSDKVNDARFLSSSLKTIAVEGIPLKLKARFLNSGTETIRSFTANYRVNGGETNSKRIKRVDITSGDVMEVEFDRTWTPSGVGKYSKVEFWISNISGDLKQSSEKLAKEVFVNMGKTADRKVLLEEFTGTWCGWCPGGMVEIKKIVAELKDDIIVAAIHYGDSMQTAETAQWNKFYGPAYPYSMINRRLWPGEARVPTGRREDDNWLIRSKKILATPTPVAIEIEPSYDPQSRILETTVTAEFVDYALPGDLRFHLYLVQDSVKGEGKGWDQRNYFRGKEEHKGHPFYDKPSIIKNYVHEHVMRAVFSGPWGTEGIIAEAPKPGDNFSKTYSMELPKSFKPEGLQLVAFVSYYGPEPGDRYVLNANVRNVPAVHQLVESDSRLEKMMIEYQKQQGLDAKEASFRQIREEFSEEDHASTYQFLYSDLASTALSDINLKKFKTYKSKVSNKVFLNILISKVLKKWANGSENLKLAVEVGESMLADFARQKVIGDKSYSSGMHAIFLQNYAVAQNKLGNYSKALESITRADEMMQEKSLFFINNHAIILTANGKSREALKILSEVVEYGNYSDGTIGALKAAYNKVNNASGFATYLESLQEAAKKKIAENQETDPQPASKFTLTDLDGKTVSLDDLKGKVVVMDFWTTWCVPCIKSFPGMQQAVNAYENDPNVKFLFVNVGQKKKKVQSWMKEKGSDYTFRVLLDQDRSVMSSFGVKGFPTKVIIDERGNIRFKSMGYSGSDAAVFNKMKAMIELVKQSRD